MPKEITQEEYEQMIAQARAINEQPHAQPAGTAGMGRERMVRTVPLDAVVKVLGGALAARALLWVNTAACGVLFGLSIMDPQPMKLAAAGGYALLVYLPMLLWRREV